MDATVTGVIWVDNEMSGTLSRPLTRSANLPKSHFVANLQGIGPKIIAGVFLKQFISVVTCIENSEY